MEALHGAEMPAGGHRMPRRRDDGHRGDEDEPERKRHREEPESREDREAPDDDDRQREREGRRHRAPPEVKRIGALGAQCEKAEDEPEVRRIEDVGAPEPDQVLGEERDGCSAGEDPPAVRAPPVPVLGTRHTQDERDAVAGEERARRPDERLLPPEDDGDFERGARHDRDQDLRDRKTEVERDLPQDLEGDDHGGQVQARVAHAGQHDRDSACRGPRLRVARRRSPARSRSRSPAVPAHLICEIPRR